MVGECEGFVVGFHVEPMEGGCVKEIEGFGDGAKVRAEVGVEVGELGIRV